MILNGINIHKNTENTITNDTGSTFGMVVTNLDDGSLVIKKEYLENDLFLGKNEGDIDTITITLIDNSTYKETIVGNNSGKNYENIQKR